jgi:hypothetical protein
MGSATFRLALVALAWLFAGCGASAQAPASETPAPETTKNKPQKSAALSPKEIAKRATPSIVRLEGEGSLGTGFVVRKDGWIATNLHVVVGAESLQAAFRDGRHFPVIEVLGYDETHDIALLRIDANDLPALELGDARAISVGDPVVAIGHPLGLSDTVSNGLISAVRDVAPNLQILQISAPIAPGSSGGPLFDATGQVIGIATALLREGQNLNFGVPVGYLKDVMDKPSPISFDAFAQSMRPSLPRVQRDVPTHAVSLLRGCGEGDLRLLAQLIVEAIAMGAPIYDRGNLAACYHLYLGASIDAEQKLSPFCAGPRGALSTGRRKAATLNGPGAQAWAMRDTFDGMLDVIRRKLDPDAE